MIPRNCILCEKNTAVQEVLTQNFNAEDVTLRAFNARQATTHKHYRMLRCACGFLFASPILPEQIVRTYYQLSNYTYQAETPNICMAYLEIWDRYLRPPINQVLEIGCANGFFLAALQERNIKILHGIEPSQEAYNQANPQIKPHIYAQFQDLPDSQTYDVVCSFQTLEHVLNPKEMLVKARRKLNKNGHLFLIMHNEQSWAARLLKGLSPIFDLQHVSLFNPRTITTLLNQCGLRVEICVPIWNTYSFAYWTQYLPEKIRPLFTRLAATPLGKIRLSIPPGNIAVIATPQP